MEDMVDLQVDYFSIPSVELIKMLEESNLESQYQKFSERLYKWDNKLLKTSTDATIYVNWERLLMKRFFEDYFPEEVKDLLRVQLYTVVDKLKKINTSQRNEFLKETFILSINELKSKFGDDETNWVYGQENYKHIKINHPLEDIVNDSIYNILSFKTYPRGGNGYTPGSTSSNLSQSSGASFRVIIDTKDWDNSLATNSPGQSGDPRSPFYRNLYKDWADDKYFKLLYSKKKIKTNLHSKEVYYPR